MKGDLFMENNNALQVFSNGEFKIRSLTENDGSIWFVAKDIAQALGYSMAGSMQSMFGHVPDIWAGSKRIAVRSENGVEQIREMLCLTEQGVYFFLGRSDKPKALPYQMWIAGDVVPSIRKHGAYLTQKTQEELINNPDLIIRLAQEIKEERAKNAILHEEKNALEAKVENDKSKVVFAESVEASPDSILVRDLAKKLRQNGFIIGGNRLFAELRERGFLIKCGSDYNMPTQKSMELGLMEILTRTINRGNGEVKICQTPKITGKGQVYFMNLFLGEK